jgi:hypothetical protein
MSDDRFTEAEMDAFMEQVGKLSPDQQWDFVLDLLKAVAVERNEARAERDQLQARIGAYEGNLQRWEEGRELIRQSSLGTPEAEAVRGRTGPALGMAMALAAEYLARAEAAEAERDRLRFDAKFANDAAEAAAKAVGDMAAKLSSVLEEREQMRAERDRLRAVVDALVERPDHAWALVPDMRAALHALDASPEVTDG